MHEELGWHLRGAVGCSSQTPEEGIEPATEYERRRTHKTTRIGQSWQNPKKHSTGRMEQKTRGLLCPWEGTESRKGQHGVDFWVCLQGLTFGNMSVFHIFGE